MSAIDRAEKIVDLVIETCNDGDGDGAYPLLQDKRSDCIVAVAKHLEAEPALTPPTFPMPVPQPLEMTRDNLGMSTEKPLTPAERAAQAGKVEIQDNGRLPPGVDVGTFVV